MVATLTYRAMGMTDDITECGHCGRTDLKSTVRMLTVDADGNDEGESYMGVTCAAKLSGRKAADIRTEATRADRARDTAIRDAHRAWSRAHSALLCAKRDAALPEPRTFADIMPWLRSAEWLAIEAAWLAENPEPTRPTGY